MSEFDKEAEREKLRKKFEREDRKRQTTEHMSELLLRGATMLNAHCDECGSPIFRFEGQEFCPTCQVAVDGQAADRDGESTTDGVGPTAETAAEPESAETAGAWGEDESRAMDESQVADDHGSAATDTGPTTVPVEPAGGDGSEPSEQQPQDVQRTPHAADEADATTGATATGSDPRATLEEAIRTLTHRAMETDDPERAREFLEAAKEAAETLAILDPSR